MTKKDILKKTGLTEEEFYKLYPTEESYKMATGGIFNSFMSDSPNFFNPEFFKSGGQPCLECGGDYSMKQYGGPHDMTFTPPTNQPKETSTKKKGSGPQLSNSEVMRHAKALSHGLPLDFITSHSSEINKYDMDRINSMQSHMKANPEKNVVGKGWDFLSTDMPAYILSAGARAGEKAGMTANEELFPDYTKTMQDSTMKGLTPAQQQLKKIGQHKKGGLSREEDYGSKKKPYPSVKSSEFAGSGRSYPIPTKADAVDALRLAGLHGRADVRAKVFAKYPELKKQFGGSMSADLQGTYPIFNSGGTEDMHQMPDGSWMANSMMQMGGDPSIAGISQDDYMNMFKGLVKQAYGGKTPIPGQKEGDILATRKNDFTSFIKDNVMSHIADEASKEAFGQLHRFTSGYKAQMGTQVGQAENSDVFWDNMYGNQNTGYGFEADVASNFKPKTGVPYATSQTPFTKTNAQGQSLNTTGNNPFEMGNPTASQDEAFVGTPKQSGQPQGKGFSYSTPTGTEQAQRIVTGINTMTGMINNKRDREAQKKWKATHSDPSNFMPVVGAGDRGKWNDGFQFSGNSISPYQSGYSQFPGNGVTGQPGTPMGEYGGIYQTGGDFDKYQTQLLLQNQYQQLQAKQKLDQRKTFEDLILNNNKISNDTTTVKPIFDSLDKKIGGGEITPNFWNASQLRWPVQMDKYSKPNTDVKHTLQPVDREDANLEAEKGEEAVVNQGGIPAKFKIAGKRHSEGGTPLNLPDNSFIFSDTKAMKINDPTILAQFGMTVKKGGYTPAEISKRYDVNSFRKILADPDSGDLNRKTAELMIANYNEKLAKLALAQESKKGFPQGIPAIAMPYLITSNINPGDFAETQATPNQPLADNTAKYGGLLKAQTGVQYKEEFIPPASMTGYISPITSTSTPKETGYMYEGPNMPAFTTQHAVVAGKKGDQSVAKKMTKVLPAPDWLKMAGIETAPVTATNVKNAHIAGPDTTITQSSLAKLTDDQLAALEKRMTEGKYNVTWKQEGGELDEFQGGGFAAERERRKKKTTPPVKHTGPAKSSTTYDPYGTDVTTAFLREHKVKGSPELYTKPVGAQKEVKAGTYGEDISLDEFKQSNPAFIQYMETKGGFDPNNKEHLKEFEKYHWNDTYNKTYDKLIASKQDPTQAAILATKIADNLSFVSKTGDVRNADQKWGNWHRSRKELQFEDPATQTTPETVVADVAKGPIAVPHITGVKGKTNAPWWLQDEINLGSAASNFARIKKYAPWQATPGTVLPDPTYVDPSRQLAANAEMANIGTQGLGVFTNPQAYAAGFSQIQGAGMKNAADILGATNNINVGIANDFARERANTLNLASREKAGLATQLYDKYTIMNQQFDNSKNQAREVMTNLLTGAITNRAYTANMNQQFPQYNIDPTSGGIQHFTGVPGAITGESSGTTIEDHYARLLKTYTPEQAKHIMDLQYGKGSKEA